jgi:hypothetical protein
MTEKRVKLKDSDGNILKPYNPDKADDSAVVHLTGDETINGVKTYKNHVYIKLNDADITDTPSAETLRSVSFRDTNNQEIGLLRARKATDGFQYIEIGARNEINGTLTSSFITSVVAKDGTVYSTAQTPASATDSSTKIATTAWVNNTANSVVHKSGTETVGGLKTFTENLIRKNNNIDYTTAPSSNTTNAYYFRDKNNEIYGAFETVNQTNGTNLIRMNVRGQQTKWSSCPLTLGVDSSGNTFTYAPTPSDSSNSTSIATTAYINNKFKLVSALPSSPDDNVWYAIPE